MPSDTNLYSAFFAPLREKIGINRAAGADVRSSLHFSPHDTFLPNERRGMCQSLEGAVRERTFPRRRQAVPAAGFSRSGLSRYWTAIMRPDSALEILWRGYKSKLLKIKAIFRTFTESRRNYNI